MALGMQPSSSGYIRAPSLAQEAGAHSLPPHRAHSFENASHSCARQSSGPACGYVSVQVSVGVADRMCGACAWRFLPRCSGPDSSQLGVALNVVLEHPKTRRSFQLKFQLQPAGTFDDSIPLRSGTFHAWKLRPSKIQAGNVPCAGTAGNGLCRVGQASLTWLSHESHGACH